MLNFIFLPYVDTFDLACSLRPRAALFGGKEIRTLMLRGPKKGAEDTDNAAVYIRSREAVRWAELKAVLNTVEQHAERIANGPVDFGRVYLEWLDAGAVAPWKRFSGIYYERFWRLHLALRSNPGAMLYSGPEALQLLPGQLTQVNVRTPHSALNFGISPRIHLVIDLAQRANNGDK